MRLFNTYPVFTAAVPWVKCSVCYCILWCGSSLTANLLIWWNNKWPLLNLEYLQQLWPRWKWPGGVVIRESPLCCGYRRWVLNQKNLSVVTGGWCWIKKTCLWLPEVCWIKILCLWLSKLNNSSEVPKLWWCLEIKNYPRSRLCDGDRS